MSDLIGKTIAQNQIVELIEETDTSQIFKGFQPNMNRYVTVVVLKSQDPAVIQAFSQQNALFAQLQHPNILAISDSGQENGITYRVLQYAEGGLLREHLFAYYDLQKASGLLSGVVAGLEKIHSQGLVHGNLQPGNIFLDEGGQPILTDFGLSKATGVPITPYLSPEQTQGDIVDRRTDIYALGVLLYEMLTGEAPPPGVVVSPRAKRPDLPETIEKVIFKAMAQNPDSRFQSAQEFQNALKAALEPVVPPHTSVPKQEAPQPVQPTTPPPPAPKKTNWAAIILGILVVILICGGIGLLMGWWTNQDGDDVALEPTSLPAEIVPTDEPPELPQEPTQEPRPTRTPRPTREPGDPENPPEIPEVCNSAGFAGSFLILGSVLMIRKNAKSKSKRRKTKGASRWMH